MAAAGNRTYTITSLQRGLRLLNLFALEETGLSAAHVARLTSLPVSTVHRFLINLESAGFLSCDSSGLYYLGTACVSLWVKPPEGNWTFEGPVCRIFRS